MSLFINLKTEGDAAISGCGKYRWSLSRVWEFSKPWVGWIMLNPSTANATKDDPTIRRCIGFARDWGYGGITVVNLFNWRATDPSELLTVENPIAKPKDIETANRLVFIQDVCPLMMVAWGAITHKPFQARAREILSLLREHAVPLHCLGMTADGSPKHPLYVPKIAKPIPYTLTPGESR